MSNAITGSPVLEFNNTTLIDLSMFRSRSVGLASGINGRLDGPLLALRPVAQHGFNVSQSSDELAYRC
jgi:hypothetical protein